MFCLHLQGVFSRANRQERTVLRRGPSSSCIVERKLHCSPPTPRKSAGHRRPPSIVRNAAQFSACRKHRSKLLATLDEGTLQLGEPLSNHQDRSYAQEGRFQKARVPGHLRFPTTFSGEVVDFADLAYFSPDTDLPFGGCHFGLHLAESYGMVRKPGVRGARATPSRTLAEGMYSDGDLEATVRVNKVVLHNRGRLGDLASAHSFLRQRPCTAATPPRTAFHCDQNQRFSFDTAWDVVAHRAQSMSPSDSIGHRRGSRLAHTGQRTTNRWRRDRAFGMQPASASLLPAILDGIDQLTLDRGARQVSFGSARTYVRSGALHAYGTRAPHSPAVRTRSIDCSQSSLRRQIPRLDAAVRSSESSDRPMGAGAIDA